VTHYSLCPGAQIVTEAKLFTTADLTPKECIISRGEIRLLVMGALHRSERSRAITTGVVTGQR
jgi:hypothetical protein